MSCLLRRAIIVDQNVLVHIDHAIGFFRCFYHGENVFRFDPAASKAFRQKFPERVRGKLRACDALRKVHTSDGVC